MNLQVHGHRAYLSAFHSKISCCFNWRSSVKLFAAIAIATSNFFALSSANASLTILKPNPTDPATFVGTGGVSTDGLGQAVPGGTIQAEVPAGSTVVQAYLYGTYYNTIDPTVAELAIDFDGTLVQLQKISDLAGFLATARADVTAQVAAKVGGGGGITDFVVNNDPTLLDGVGLVVIYSNAVSPITTVAVLDGSASQSGDVANFSFAAPLDKTVPGFSATMAVGSGFSFQNVDGNVCGGGQFSTIDINGGLLTNCAGNYDDGYASNGGLITVGGVGDSRDNPTPPETPAIDDELYDLDPFLNQGDTGITITTSNPSQDDNLFLAVIAITAEARVTTEVCDDGIDNDGDGLIDGADPDCQLPPGDEICTDGIDNDGDGLIDENDPDCQTIPNPSSQRMTGGGWQKMNGKKVKHGFNLRCDLSDPGLGNNLQVNWGRGDKFHLQTFDSAVCEDAEGIDSGKPVAGFDTISGSGTGRYNGEEGAKIEFVFTDAGEPGKQDTSSITVRNADNDIVLQVSGTLGSGNHQAHP